MKNIRDIISDLDNLDEKKSHLTRELFLEKGTEASPFLEAALCNPNYGIAEEAARVLGMFGKKAEKSIPSLIQAAQSEHAKLRAYSVGSLGRIAQNPELCIGPLVFALKDSQAIVRQHAVAALSMFGHDAIEAVPELVIALADSDAVVREFATSTLREIKFVPTEILSRISKKISKPDGESKRNIDRWKTATKHTRTITS